MSEMTESEFLSQKGGYLALHGAKLIDQGYTPVPIQKGKKAPGYDGWQKSLPNKSNILEWITSGHKWSGVGLLTKNTPAIDIDVRDEEVAVQIEDWVRKHIGDAPLRIGRAPKRLMVFRTNNPFRKLRSAKYEDEWGEQHQIEILGDGQQFVAYHKHPDTGKPYHWPNEGENPIQVRATDLPTLEASQAEELIEFFEGIAVEKEWKLVKAAHRSSQALNADNPWAEDSSTVTIDDDELRKRLMLVPHPDDYDDWIRIGMALYHQYDGDDEGLSMWHEWAESADNYDGDALDRRWEGFSIKEKKRAPITARFILRMAQEATETAAAEMTMTLRDAFQGAKDLAAWEKARQMAREAEIDNLSRSSIAQVAKATRDQITGTKTALVEIKKAIAYMPKKMDRMPEWCENWVYDTAEDKFFSLATKCAASQQGFNAMFDRRAMTKKDVLEGKTAPSSTASALALNAYRIPVVAGRRYMPGDDAIFTLPDGTFANTYPEHEIPEVPEKMTPRDKRNVERVKAHIHHLIADPKEARLFLDWLSWVVQNPGKHVRHAVLLQGVQGDGKTFFAEMMRAVMGVSNVTMLNAHILHSDFTDWAEGQCLACFEEVRLVNDKNKYEILNRIKPFITNTINEIHPKGKPIINVKNTTSYLLFTNYKDALPIEDKERRYFVLFSRWQSKWALDAFRDEHPTYYTDLYETIEDSAPALRKWLINHEQSDDFKPMEPAPVTKAFMQMVKRAKPAFILALDEVIAEDAYPEVGRDLLDLTRLNTIMYDLGMDAPQTKAMSAMLDRDGYEPLGRVLTTDGERHFFYSKSLELFTDSDGAVVRRKVLEHLERRTREVNEI